MESINNRPRRGPLSFLGLVAIVVLLVATAVLIGRSIRSPAPPVPAAAGERRTGDGKPLGQVASAAVPLLLKDGARPGAARPAGLPWTEDHVVVRGPVHLWYELDRPPGWSGPAGGEDTVQMLHPSEALAAKLEIARGIGLLDLATDPPPAGTVSTTLTVDGVAATRQRLPDEPLDDGSLACIATVAVPVAAALAPAGALPDESARNELRIGQYVAHAADASACAETLARMDEAVVSIHRLPDRSIGVAWTGTRGNLPASAGHASYHIRHPAGWTVAPLGAGIAVASSPAWPGGGAGVAIQIEPHQPPAYFGAAEPLAGADGVGVRQVSSVVAGGQRATEYATNQLFPTRWRVTATDVPLASDAYWAIDQTVWRMLLDSTFTYDEAPGYP